MKLLGILTVLLCILGFCVHYWSAIIKKSMEYIICIDKKRAFVDEDIRLFTQITNRKIVPIPWIMIEVKLPIYFNFNNSKVQIFSQTKNLFKIITSLLFFEELSRYDSFKCSKRGLYKLKTAEIEIGDFLGLAKTNLQVNIDNDLIVYPKIKELVELIYVPKSLQGDLSVRRWIIKDPTQVLGVRKYTIGDSFNIIDWKASARNNDLYVKKFDFTSDPSIMIFLDIQTENAHWMGVNYEVVEQGIDLVASLMDKALNEKVATGYTANTTFQNEKDDVFIYPSNNGTQRIKILEALAKTTYERTYTITNLLNLRINSLGKCCTIILLLSYIPKELINDVNYYSKIGYNIKIILLNSTCSTTGLNKNIELIHSIEKGESLSHVQ